MTDRRTLQAEGKHPAPCARHCEAKAFEIEIRGLKSALRARLEQPEQEPVAYLSQAGNFLSPLEFTVGEAALYGWTPVYTSPPQRQWVGLTAEDLAQIESDEFWSTGNHMAIALAVEDKLKEKNT